MDRQKLGITPPSILTKNVAIGTDLVANFDGRIFKCPQCNCVNLATHDTYLACEDCGAKWSTQDGIYDFREPIP